jgi:hypothetical protein
MRLLGGSSSIRRGGSPFSPKGRRFDPEPTLDYYKNVNKSDRLLGGGTP